MRKQKLFWGIFNPLGIFLGFSKDPCRLSGESKKKLKNRAPYKTKLVCQSFSYLSAVYVKWDQNQKGGSQKNEKVC